MAVPTLWTDVPSLEERLRPFVPNDVRRAVVERMLGPATHTFCLPGNPPLGAASGPTQDEASNEVFEGVARLVGGLLQQLEDLAPDLAREGFVREVSEAFAPVAAGPDRQSLSLAWPGDITTGDVSRWIAQTTAPRARIAPIVSEVLGALEHTWPALQTRLREAFEWTFTGDADAPRIAARGVFRACHASLTAALVARAFRAWRELQRDRGRPFMALDAGVTHHALLSRWRDLPKSKPLPATKREGWAEILHPGKQLGLRLDMRDLPERIVHVIKAWRSWHGLRHWAALQTLFTAAGRTGRVRWCLEDHMQALGYNDRARRNPKVRDRVASEVVALTRMEIAVYHPDGTVRLRGPVLAVTQRGEALRGARWALEGLELVIHPVLYEGVRNARNELGTLWAPAPAELAKIDHVRHPYALALGLILPIRWRWDTLDGLDHLALSGEKLLEAAGIPWSEHDPGRAWTSLERDLAELVRVGGLGSVLWDKGEHRTRSGLCRLYPPSWIRERLLHHIPPRELPPGPKLLTGGELRAWRKKKNWTQVEAAKALGVSERTLRNAEAAPDAPLGRSIRQGLSRHAVTPAHDETDGNPLPSAPSASE